MQRRDEPPESDRRLVVAALLGALALVALFRLLSLPAVFRDGVVVLSSNDPYFYRTVVEGIHRGAEYGPQVTEGEPLYVFTMVAITAVLGVDATGMVLAWYPVVSALLTAGLVYLIALELTDDRRVALAAVVMLAILPAHAFRTSLGFADHHAFDYLFLTLTAYGLIRDDWLGAAAIAVGLGAQVLAWEAGPLLLFPVALVMAARVVVDIEQGGSPTRVNAPVVAGLGGGAAIALLGHLALGWQQTVVAAVPALLFVGAVALVLAGEAAVRFGLDGRTFVGVEIGAAIVGIAGVALLLPGLLTQARRATGLLTQRNIAETQSLFGPSFGWLLLFGFLLVIAVPYFAWAVSRVRHMDRGWPVVGLYGGWFLALATVEIRFAGELGPFVAVVAGLAFVHLAAKVDITHAPTVFGGVSALRLPTRRETFSLFALFLLVGGLAMVQVPIKTTQITISDAEYGAAAWIDSNTEDGPPEEYVFSKWGRNRMYNYFVNGGGLDYAFALDNYRPFMSATDPGGWYSRLDGQVSYLVTEPSDGPTEALGVRLHTAYGSRNGDVPGLAHYRAVYVSDGGERKVFEVVPGATVRGTADPNSTVRLAVEKSVSGATFTYERTVRANATGEYAAVVPYTGEYQVGNETVRVTETAVRRGGTVAA
ncbi:STT3 domain-containing protein [Natronomonas sp. EA1]|uniref:STT3 domain-containing protein n=1 Tax=Natronomonas sp. EA1 TaxID=3421655 RepID=UPI003EBE4190